VILYRMKVTLPPDPICAGRQYDATVRISADQQYVGEDGELHDLTSVSMDARTVEAFAQDESIASMRPRSSITGWDVGGTGFSIDVDAPGEATFNLHANKAGTTTLYFEAYIPEAVAAYQQPYFGPKASIKVVNCKYRVRMSAIDVYSSDITIWTNGNLDTEITGDGGEMKGSGSFTFGSGFVGPPCSITYSEYANPTTITGHFDKNDQLILDFRYQPGTITNHWSCPEGSGSASQAIDLTNTGVTSASFPASGGTQAITFTYKGSDAPPGTMIINVQPVSEEGGS
jgi:hypothetical protein